MDSNEIIANIKTIRNSRNLTQGDMAEALGINRATYINIEAGRRKLALDELEKLCDKLGVTPSDILSPSEHHKALVEEKFKQVYYYILEKHFKEHGVPKTKLAKLLYLSDFAYYYDNNTSITGARYYKLTYGPVADLFFTMTDSLFEDGKIRINILDTAQMISISDTNTDKKFEELSNSEKDMIDKICDFWRDKNTAEIVNFTHSQKPWKDRKDGEYIPYISIKEEPRNNVYAPLPA